ncbi:bactofilin family protein [Paenibacillus thalictri]|uniref:Polymer-forming cytoskeletal protein n=1 Tax=Paenibacillus thalictri TaxID=2527873 RepID=A0A4Q9DFU7_9BACL|nr:polymer-forming cytoskeletal protein [Paenibacillus thalictri]TBL71025.1 hypothetical protein EYB31_31260 [Paenibacillus thalictri]
MFGKRRSSNPNLTDTLIGERTVFEGKINSDASVRIEGKVTGDIECKGDVTVVEMGSARSNIKARDVVIAGTLNGSVTATGKVTIMSKGKLYGNVVAGSFIIDNGGIFQGMSKIDSSRAAMPKETSPDTAAAPAAENRVEMQLGFGQARGLDPTPEHRSEAQPSFGEHRGLDTALEHRVDDQPSFGPARGLDSAPENRSEVQPSFGQPRGLDTAPQLVPAPSPAPAPSSGTTPQPGTVQPEPFGNGPTVVL